MNEEERIDKATRAIVASDERKADRIGRYVWKGIAAGVAFAILQTLLIFGTAAFLGQGQQDLAARIDRGLAFTVCVLDVHPNVQSNQDLLRCYGMASNLYPGLEPPLPTPVLTPTEGSS